MVNNTNENKTNEKVSFSDITFKELRISGANVEIPKLGLITASRVRKNPDNKDEVSAVIFTAIDAEVAQKLISVGVSIDQLKGFTVEYEASPDILNTLNHKSLVGKSISLEHALLAPLWVTRGNSGSYSALKLVIYKIEIVE